MEEFISKKQRKKMQSEAFNNAFFMLTLGLPMALFCIFTTFRLFREIFAADETLMAAFTEYLIWGLGITVVGVVTHRLLSQRLYRGYERAHIESQKTGAE